MNKLYYGEDLGSPLVQSPSAVVVGTKWRQGLPVLHGQGVTLRELRTTDAPSLFAMLTSDEVARFISPPPVSVDGFERFITWAIRQREAGAYACFAVTLTGYDTAIGLFQIRALASGFDTAEWGFALGSAFWGTGVFLASAAVVLDFTFDVVGVHRLEARAAVHNGRGNGALLKLGAVHEGLLRKSFHRHDGFLDQILYSLLDADWFVARLGLPLSIPGCHPRHVSLADGRCLGHRRTHAFEHGLQLVHVDRREG